jgi:predicted Fe-Mo cluster-binding NifX family protein
MLIAVPSLAPGGLDAPVEGHFGHCAGFTVVKLDGDAVAEVKVLSNNRHGAGSCGAPVTMLAEAGVQALVVGGIGMRPLELLKAQGIGVYITRAATVRQAVADFTSGRLQGFDPSQACGGHGPGGCPGHK